MAQQGSKESKSFLKKLGPGLVTGAADDDPSGVATYSQTGAQFGNGLLWTMILTYPLMSAIQLISAQIGRVTGKGLSANLSEVLPGWVVHSLVGLLLIANTINIGANLAAMGASAELLAHGGSHLFTLGFAALSLGLQLFVPYARYVGILKWLTLVLLAYVAVLFAVHLDWASIGRGLAWPVDLKFTPAVVTTIVAIFGTTISPYLFFWQAAQEVEEIGRKTKAQPLVDAPRQAPAEKRRMRLDTLVGMAVSNLVAIAIMIATAATLHAQGRTNIASAADAAKALEPAAGHFAFLLFALGIVGTGLLSIPVLAGASAYAVGECRAWKCGLAHKPWEAPGFYGVIVVATLLGVGIDWSPVDPMKALFWSAVINGVVAVPMMAAMMAIASRRTQMGPFVISMTTRVLGWAATVVMGVAAVAMLALMAMGKAN